jgi:hypothetical protein
MRAGSPVTVRFLCRQAANPNRARAALRSSGGGYFLEGDFPDAARERHGHMAHAG